MYQEFVLVVDAIVIELVAFMAGVVLFVLGLLVVGEILGRGITLWK